jgi:galactose mutarotase-like enzyme
LRWVRLVLLREEAGCYVQQGRQTLRAKRMQTLHHSIQPSQHTHTHPYAETQGFPNAVNTPAFPPVVLRPRGTYKHDMVYRFPPPSGKQ